MAKQMETDKDFAKAVSMARDEDQKQVMLRRQSRTPPTDHIELIEYFLNTQADDMEVGTCRLQPLTPVAVIASLTL